MIQIVLCDDNPQFLASLRDNIRTVLGGHYINATLHCFENAETIPEQILGCADVFFLDIDFGGKEHTGIDLARKIRQFRQDSIIVFVTNYVEYAPEGYEVQAFRYCLKSEIHNKLEQYLLQTISRLNAGMEMLQISISGETISIPLAEILYIESQGHAVLIHTMKSGSQAVKLYKFYATLTSLEERLSDQGFLRIQKSYLVNMKRLKRFGCSEAVLDNGTVLPVSEINYAKQKKQYLLWKGRQ